MPVGNLRGARQVSQGSLHRKRRDLRVLDPCRLGTLPAPHPALNRAKRSQLLQLDKSVVCAPTPTLTMLRAGVHGRGDLPWVRDPLPRGRVEREAPQQAPRHPHQVARPPRSRSSSPHQAVVDALVLLVSTGGCSCTEAARLVARGVRARGAVLYHKCEALCFGW
eukprot:1041820-Rhodomonas_salina.2